MQMERNLKAIEETANEKKIFSWGGGAKRNEVEVKREVQLEVFVLW